jgi:hypothetical protein
MADESKPKFSADDLAMLSPSGSSIAPWQDESLPPADRLKALTSLLHQGDAGAQEYAKHQDLAIDLTRQVRGGATPAPSGGKIDTAAIAQREDRLQQLMKDAHKEDSASRRRYEAAQPEIMRLVSEIQQLKRGERATREVDTALRREPVKATPMSIVDYPDLTPMEGEAETHWLAARTWSELLPIFAEAGVPVAAVEKISGKFYGIAKTVVDGVAEELAEVRNAALAEAGRELAEQTAATLRQRHGSNYDAVMHEANENFKRLAPGGVAKLIANLPLATGGVLGAHPDFVNLMISLRPARRW